MRTELQRRAARLNGLKSRGPITAAGRLRSSQNARRHGLYSQDVLPAPPPASPDPQTLLQLAWLHYLRVAELEARILDEEIARQRTLHPEECEPGLRARAWRHLCDETRVMQAHYRLQSAASRHLKEAMARFGRAARTILAEGTRPRVIPCGHSSLATPARSGARRWHPFRPPQNSRNAGVTVHPSFCAPLLIPKGAEPRMQKSAEPRMRKPPEPRLRAAGLSP